MFSSVCCLANRCLVCLKRPSQLLRAPVPPCPFQILGKRQLEGTASPVALPLDEVGAIRGGVRTTKSMILCQLVLSCAPAVQIDALLLVTIPDTWWDILSSIVNFEIRQNGS